MARIILGSYMVRYPLGGMLSYVLQYLAGLDRLGHDVWFVEKADYPDACFDPRRRTNGDDGSYGMEVVDGLLDRFELAGRWCFVDRAGVHHGLSRKDVDELFSTADLFIDMGTHGAWLPEAATTSSTMLIEGEPAFTQIKWQNRMREGEPTPEYDHYFTNGLLVGTSASPAPTAGVQWHRLPHPVDTARYSVSPIDPEAAFTTVMNWQSHDPIEFEGRVYGQKDVEFEGFFTLPTSVDAGLEIAVAGNSAPLDRLEGHGWAHRDAIDVSATYDTFVDYVRGSIGEFSVCKNVFVANRTGWFSDRSAFYLAQGRPVVLQDTGFSECLPVGEGLFAPTDVDEAAAAIDQISSDPERHSRAAREIACDVLDTRVVLGKALAAIGIS